MKITNKLGLPEPIVRAVTNDPYTMGDSYITATGLIEPPRIGALKIKHQDELTEDVSDRIYTLDGQAKHVILERAAESLKAEGWLVEERLYTELLGKRISAQIDVYNPLTGLLQDYKNTSVYSVMQGLKEDYAIQLNIQAELLRRNGYQPKRLQIVAMLRDWSKREYQREYQRAHELGVACAYPSNQVVVLDCPCISSEEVVQYMSERLGQHVKAREAKKDSQLPSCSSEDRWERPAKYAVVERGKKRAMRLFDTEEAAQAFRQTRSNKPLYIEYRPGESIRCESYCPVSNFCSQKRKMNE